MEGEIHYIGLLSNVDSSICKIKFERGFKISTMGIEEAKTLLSKLLDMEEYQSLSMLMRYQAVSLSDDIVYYLSNTIVIKPGGSTTSQPYINVPAFERDSVDNYLSPIVKLMRLYNGGNILIPYHIYYHVENDAPKRVFDWGWTAPTKSLPFSLTDDEIKKFDEFIQRTKIPFSRSFLQLSFENFELSYDVLPPNIEFLILMISLEILFNPSDNELRNRISRNAAILLGVSLSDSQLIYKTIKDLYDKRSVLVHTGTSTVSEGDLRNIRNYVRRSIKLISEIDDSKENILKTLNESGFGSRPFTKNQT